MNWKSSKFKSKNRFKDFFPVLNLDGFKKKKTPSSGYSLKHSKAKKSSWFNKKKSPVSHLHKLALKPNYFHYLFCIFSGLVAGWCFPSNDTEIISAIKAVLIWFAFAPFFVVLWQTKTIFGASLKAALTGFCFNLVVFRFLIGIHPLDWLGVPDNLSLAGSISGMFIAATIQAFYWAIYGIIFKLLHKSLGITLWTAFQVSVIWVVLFEKIANSVLLKGLPLSSLYYTQHNNFYLLQSSDLMGASLTSLLIVFFNVTLAHLLTSLLKLQLAHAEGSNNQALSLSAIMGLQGIVVLSLCYLYGGFYYFSQQNIVSQSGLQPIKVALLQKNLEVSSTRILSESTTKNLNGFIKQFKEIVNNKFYPDLIVIPEGSLRKDSLEKLFNFIASVNPTISLIGGSYVDIKDVGNYNSAIGFNSRLTKENKVCSLAQKQNLQQKQIYFKQALVIFGEYVPFEAFFKQVLAKFNLEYLAESDFKTGDKPKVFELNIGNFAPLICFEIFFPELANDQVKAGGESLVLLGDTSWFHQSKHSIGGLLLAAAKVRAVETRKDTLVIANQGPLALIDRFGRVNKLAEENKESLFGEIHKNQDLTLFTRSQW